MNTTENPNDGQSTRADVPGWLALIIALLFWIILLPLVHGGIPWALSLLGPRYGWVEGRPAAWNLLGLIPITLATILLIWLMVLHFSRFPKRVKLERTPTYLLMGGPYRFTRNPMYIAEMALWLGWVVYYGSFLISIGFLVGWWVFDFMIVPREERDLEARFGDSYLQYKNKVPRWFGKIPL